MDYFAEVALLSAAAVVVVEQILKLKVVPVSFANNHPVLVNVLLSIVAAVVVNYQTAVSLVNWQDWLLFVGLVSVVSAITFNQLVGKSEQVRKLEG